MKKILITLLIIGFISIGLSASSYLHAEKKDESTETWKGTAEDDLMGISYDVTLILKRKGDKYESGTITVQKIITRELKNIEFKNDTLKFELVYTENDTDYAIKAKLEVIGNQMEGTWEVEYEDISGTMELTKKEK